MVRLVRSLGRIFEQPFTSKSALKKIRAGQISAAVAMVVSQPEASHADYWHQLCARLWETYEREEVAQLLVEAAPRSDAMILQYWISQVLTIEPEIADSHFEESFLAEHFQPEVAARCGKRGCCG